MALKFKLRIDDSVNTAGVHLVGGFWGMAMVGFFADKSINPHLATTVLNESGIFWGGRGTLLGNQILAAAVTVLWSMAMTFIIVKFLNRFMVLRAHGIHYTIGLLSSSPTCHPILLRLTQNVLTLPGCPCH